MKSSIESKRARDERRNPHDHARTTHSKRHSKRPSRLRVALAALAVGLTLGVAGAGLGPAASASAAAASAAATSMQIDINRAGPDELQKLPGVGKARAEAIVEMRKARGGFKSVDELLDVRGIGDVMLERMRPHVSVGGAPGDRK